MAENVVGSDNAGDRMTLYGNVGRLLWVAFRLGALRGAGRCSASRGRATRHVDRRRAGRSSASGDRLVPLHRQEALSPVLYLDRSLRFDPEDDRAVDRFLDDPTTSPTCSMR
jgi:hypothetical protein